MMNRTEKCRLWLTSALQKTNDLEFGIIWQKTKRVILNGTSQQILVNRHLGSNQIY
ncbi:Uncharacterized protein BM_BM14367 [Brugia malayi]|uniref:Bm14367 n=1 Tax=Brugia malayi TaxID=6279 RepID=A0A0K0J0Z4_BRUMA|nr:Uncharacterized protein BM_BM14367 [Brugia malayi]CDQ02460.2 Bm14367 [Brugia malayi]VIO96481.1 Uncharacterized protein BM_BM14367 [Brugia malayi]